MNIFAVSRHPWKCARALDDKRLNKMILETTQLICTGLNELNKQQVTPYRSSHVNHPITKWMLDGWEYGYDCWLWQLGMAYGKEIIHRKGRKHACQLVLEGLTFKWPGLDQHITMREEDFYNGARHRGLGLDFTHLPTFEAYKAYLNARWPGDKRKPVWTNREPPIWKGRRA